MGHADAPSMFAFALAEYDSGFHEGLTKVLKQAGGKGHLSEHVKGTLSVRCAIVCPMRDPCSTNWSHHNDLQGN